MAVERRLAPELRGVPLGVVQYDARSLNVADFAPEPAAARRDDRSDGSLIAVSYEARARGVKRQMRGIEARQCCPELKLVRVPTSHGKADITLYRNAGEEVLSALAEALGEDCAVEKASIDESYADATPAAKRALARRPWKELVAKAAAATKLGGGSAHHSRAEARNGFGPAASGARGGNDEARRALFFVAERAALPESEQLLIAAAAVVAEARERVEEKTTFSTSGGIATNKLLAKLASGMHKPRQQTLLAPSEQDSVMRDLPLDRLRGLGGKLGDTLKRELDCETASELAACSEARVRAAVGERNAAFAITLAKGIDTSPVKDRREALQTGYSKTFRGKNELWDDKAIEHWVLELARQLAERLAAERLKGREHTGLTLGLQSRAIANKGGWKSISLNCPLRPAGGIEAHAKLLAAPCVTAIRRWIDSLPRRESITCLSVGASKFERVDTKRQRMLSFVPAGSVPKPEPKTTPAEAADDLTGGAAGTVCAAGATDGNSRAQLTPTAAMDAMVPPEAQEADSASFALEGVDLAEQRLLMRQFELNRQRPAPQPSQPRPTKRARGGGKGGGGKGGGKNAGSQGSQRISSFFVRK